MTDWVMMQTVLTKYWLTVHIGLLLFFSWCRLVDPRATGMIPLLWLSLLAVEALALLPAVRRSETLADARVRVGRAVAWDPFLYFGLALVGVAVAQWLNSDRTLVYLADADRWQYSDPSVAWLPSSVEARAALTYVSVFVACVVGGVSLRQSVSKTGKRYFLQAASALSGGIALCMVWQACCGVAPYAGIARMPSACAPGSFFGFWLVIGMGASVDALERSQRGVLTLALLACVGNLLGMLFFASAPVLALYAVVSLLLSLYGLVYLNANVPKHVQFKLFLAVLAVAAGVALSLAYAFPDNPVAAKLREFLDVEAYWRALSSTKSVRTSAALTLWKEHPWVGVGASGFRHYVGTVITGKEWALVRADQGFVYNDSLQLLCEFGTLGAGVLVAAVVTLMVPISYRARLAWRLTNAGAVNAGRAYLLRLSPLVVTGVLATALCFLESWFANPFRLPALLLSWVLVMAMIPAFLPATERNLTAG